MRLAVLALAVLALTGCESTQSKSAKLERVAQKSKHEKGLVVGEQSKDIKVEGTTVLQDANGAAAVVELRNDSSGSLVGLPISMQVLDKASKPLYANDAPGKNAHFTVFPIGDPNGAALSAAAPPTVVTP
jgi:protein-disulfide isomerase